MTVAAGLIVEEIVWGAFPGVDPHAPVASGKAEGDVIGRRVEHEVEGDAVVLGGFDVPGEDAGLGGPGLGFVMLVEPEEAGVSSAGAGGGGEEVVARKDWVLFPKLDGILAELEQLAVGLE